MAFVTICGLCDGFGESGGPGDGVGFNVGNVKVGRISEVPTSVVKIEDGSAESGGESNPEFELGDKDAYEWGGIYDTDVGIGETVPDPRDFDLNLGGLIYVVVGSGLTLLPLLFE